MSIYIPPGVAVRVLQVLARVVTSDTVYIIVCSGMVIHISWLRVIHVNETRIQDPEECMHVTVERADSIRTCGTKL